MHRRPFEGRHLVRCTIEDEANILHKTRSRQSDCQYKFSDLGLCHRTILESENHRTNNRTTGDNDGKTEATRRKARSLVSSSDSYFWQTADRSDISLQKSPCFSEVSLDEVGENLSLASVSPCAICDHPGSHRWPWLVPLVVSCSLQEHHSYFPSSLFSRNLYFSS